MKQIKTRHKTRDIKALNKATTLSAHMKNAAIKSKTAFESANREAAETQGPQHDSPAAYASDHMTSGAKGTAERAAVALRKNPARQASANMGKAKQHMQEARRQVGNIKNAAKPATQHTPQKEMVKRARSAQHTATQARHSAKSTVKTMQKAAPQITKTSKDTVKTVQKSIKTAGQGGKVAVKTAQQTAKGAQRTAQATAKAAKAAAQAARSAAKNAVAAIKIAAKALAAMVKAVIAALQALVAVIMAGGWAAVAVILIICLIALLMASPFGIFFSGDAAGGTSPIHQVVADTSHEFSARIIGIVNDNPHDEMRIAVTNRGYLRADNWMDVLAVYAISTATQDTGGRDVVLMDEAKIAKIREIFWEMVEVNHNMEPESHEEPVLDEDGNDTGNTTIVTKQILILEIIFRGAAETAAAKGFTLQQNEILTEMLNGDYDEMFRELIGSIGPVSMTGDGSGAVGTGSFIWPVPSSDRVTSPFGSRADPISGKFATHLGIDIPGAAGAAIVASDGGTVASTNIDASYGNHALIDHGNGSSTLYAHMDSLLVSAGEAVTQGQQLGGMGATGRVTGVHLHLEVWQNGARVDPLQFFNNYTTAW